MFNFKFYVTARLAQVVYHWQNKQRVVGSNLCCPFFFLNNPFVLSVYFSSIC